MIDRSVSKGPIETLLAHHPFSDANDGRPSIAARRLPGNRTKGIVPASARLIAQEI